MIPPTSAVALAPSVVEALPAITTPPQEPGCPDADVIITGFAAVPRMFKRPPC